MKKFKLEQTVIVTTKKGNRVAKLLSKSVRGKRRVFNVVFEDGTKMLYLPVDDPAESMFVNSQLTEKLIPKISDKTFSKISIDIED